MRLHRTVSLNTLEQQTVAKAALSVRIAFGDEPDRQDKAAWKAYGGRHLLAVATQRDRFAPEQIAGAIDACAELISVLSVESRREYWEQALQPTPPPEQLNRTPSGRVVSAAVGLVAPGTDICGVLAEQRERQLLEVRDAMKVLMDVADLVGPPILFEHDED